MRPRLCVSAADLPSSLEAKAVAMPLGTILG